MELLVLLALLGGGVLVYRHVSADARGRDLAWTGRSADGTPTTNAGAPYRSNDTAPTLGVAAGLSRIEARRLLASPLVWVGLALVGLACVTVLDSGIPDQSEWLSLSGRFIPLLIYPLCGLVLVAANRAALRPRRDGTIELLDSLPTRPGVRSLGLMAALWAPVLVGVGATAAQTVSVWFGSGKDSGAGLWSRSELDLPFADIGIANLFGAVVLVACGGVLGIALARLLPWGLVPIVAVVVIGVATGVLGGDDLPGIVGSLGPVANGGDLPSFLSPVAQGWHVVYLLGLGTIAVGAAFLLDGERRWGACGLAAAAVLVAASLVGLSRTYAGDTAQGLAALITDPAPHQRCLEGDGVTVCHFPELDEIAARWVSLAEPVRAAAPAGVIDGPLEIQTRVSDEEIGQLAAPVRDELDRRGDSFPWTDEPGIHPDLRWDGGDALRAMLVAHGLVGLPEAGAPPVEPCFAGGQARSAVAVALAGRGLRLDERDTLRAPPQGPYGLSSVTNFVEADWEVDSEPAVVHAESDLALGRALLERPVDEVREVLAADWSTWVDPRTPTEELAAAFGLTARPPTRGPGELRPCR
ncbi:MAG: hypothetical protein JNK12_08225 [Acidimicrobiales bacterium]|nr:hypothetical protein [Acidimicrobiales bacterium]